MTKFSEERSLMLRHYECFRERDHTIAGIQNSFSYANKWFLASNVVVFMLCCIFNE